ncbi:MAG: YHS domain-containing protein [Deltaproteobacteria bacterium]
MGPFRLAILIFLLYLLYRLVTGGGRHSEKKTTLRQKSDQPTHDVLVEDPVCHTYIPKGQAVTWRKNGTTHYFCSTTCKDKFKEMNP